MVTRAELAKDLRELRERFRFAKICRNQFENRVQILSVSDRLRLSFASDAFINQEVEFLKEWGR